MGGCASKPKDLDVRPESVPSEAPASPKKAEGEAVVAQENVDDGGDKTQKEEPLVDLSEPKEEAKGDSSSESKPADAPVVESKPDETTATPTKEIVEKPSEKKAEAGKEEKTEPAKEVQQVEAVEVTEEAKIEPSSEDKSDAPLVTV